MLFSIPIKSMIGKERTEREVEENYNKFNCRYKLDVLKATRIYN
jgi:hypothetical protein